MAVKLTIKHTKYYNLPEAHAGPLLCPVILPTYSATECFSHCTKALLVQQNSHEGATCHHFGNILSDISPLNLRPLYVNDNVNHYS